MIINENMHKRKEKGKWDHMAKPRKLKTTHMADESKPDEGEGEPQFSRLDLEWKPYLSPHVVLFVFALRRLLS